ncbi:MAG TPA: DNA methyltransferase [Actinomycetota bacterium]|nr:DNA methyltransferase [Actinomycetota bacterium]
MSGTNGKKRRPAGTTTSDFGVGSRENHDASPFYDRFVAPELSRDDAIARQTRVNEIVVGDARHMEEVEDGSVALVVTSPPYFAGKEYEATLGEGHVPATYLEYLKMLEEVFAECVHKLEPGGRIAVNVANLGRKPYRSLSSDVITILQDRLRLLLRGEVIWQKARGSSGSCAWGSFQRPANPVLRDLTERVVIASKGRFDRALTARERQQKGHPSTASLWSDEYMEATTDVWEIPSESATRVGHPAPFPVDLPKRLIHLYTYKDDLVLDPFMGSGTTAVAAIRTGRNFFGYDTDEAYVLKARARVLEARAAQAIREEDSEQLRFELPATKLPVDSTMGFQQRAVAEGRAAKQIAHAVLMDCEFEFIEENVRLPSGVEVNFRAKDRTGTTWLFDVSGGFTSNRPGLKRTDTLWKALGKAAVLHETHPDTPLVLLTTDAPPKGTAGDLALQVVLGDGKPIKDVIQMRSKLDRQRLRRYVEHGPAAEPVPSPDQPDTPRVAALDRAAGNRSRLTGKVSP